jgi:hypothetical protein
MDEYWLLESENQLTKLYSMFCGFLQCTGRLTLHRLAGESVEVSLVEELSSLAMAALE